MSEPSAILQLRERRRAELELVIPDTRTTILRATERVLEGTSLQDISVAQIVGEAGVSRKTFYSYFGSKYEVAATLLERVMEEMYERMRPLLERDPAQSREDAIREVLSESIELWSRHRFVFRATHENWHAVPELHDQWLAATERFTDAVEAELQREVDAGTAPADIDVRQRAATVVWTTEHLLYIAGTGVHDPLPDETAILGTLVTLWLGTLFGPAASDGGA